jgi:phospholipase/carboxylesterase
VLFHQSGSSAEEAIKLAPQMSDRNFVMVSLESPSASREWNPDAVDNSTLSAYVRDAVMQTRRTYHIHSERIYLVGINDGCDAAYRAAFDLGEQVAGVVAVNGNLPLRVAGQPLFRWDQVRQLKVMIARNQTNQDAIREARLLDTAGANVTLRAYNTALAVHSVMLGDVNRWVMQQVVSAPIRTPVQKVR